jgi:hypothetical protein
MQSDFKKKPKKKPNHCKPQIKAINIKQGTRSTVVGRGTNATSRKVAGSTPDDVIGFFNGT